MIGNEKDKYLYEEIFGNIIKDFQYDEPNYSGKDPHMIIKEYLTWLPKISAELPSGMTEIIIPVQ